MFSLRIISLFLYLSGVFGDLRERPKSAPCNIDDVKCITDVFQWLYGSVIAGAPEHGIETSDPMYHELIEGKLPFLSYDIKNANIEGFKTCKINRARVNSDISNFHIDMICRRYHMDGEYNIDGNILQYPIKGEGTFIVDATNYHITVDNELKFYKKNGNLHIMYKNFKYTATLLGEFDFELRNLFGGKKELSEALIRFAKDNSKLFASFLQDPIIRTNMKKLMKSFNIRLKSIPAAELLQIDD